MADPITDSTGAPAPNEGKQPYENRVGWACCLPPRSPTAKCDFIGVTKLDGKKHWVRVYKKLDRDGAPYVSVNIVPWEEQG
jgi:hypothetical protein